MKNLCLTHVADGFKTNGTAPLPRHVPILYCERRIKLLNVSTVRILACSFFPAGFFLLVVSICFATVWVKTNRSCDLGLGVPFNIASYALLTILVANVCRLKPGVFVHMMADTHMYLNHVGALQQQLLRTPTAPPKLRILKQLNNVEELQWDDLLLEDYHPQPSIHMDMAV